MSANTIFEMSGGVTFMMSTDECVGMLAGVTFERIADETFKLHAGEIVQMLVKCGL